MRELGRREGVQVIIFTGAGGKAFASGTDIRAIHDRTVAGADEQRGQRYL